MASSKEEWRNYREFAPKSQRAYTARHEKAQTTAHLAAAAREGRPGGGTPVAARPLHGGGSPLALPCETVRRSGSQPKL